MIDEGCCSREKRVGDVVAGRGAKRVLIESAIETPPDALEYLHEVLGSGRGIGKPERCQSTVDVGVGIDLARRKNRVGAWVFRSVVGRDRVDSTVDDPNRLSVAVRSEDLCVHLVAPI